MSDNLPPGVSVNQIPGNRPEDEASEHFWEAMYAMTEGLPDEEHLHGLMDDDQVQRLILLAWEIGQDIGWADARAEEELRSATDRSMLRPT